MTRNACSILVRNASPTKAPGERQPPDRVPDRLDRSQGGVRRTDQQQGQQRVRVVEPEHQHRHRRGRQHDAGEQPGRRRPGRTPDRGVEQPHGRHALKRLRDQQAPGGQPEDPDRQRHRPQRERRLVDGDGVRGVRGAEEERLPRLRPGLRRRGVEAVRPAGRAEPPQVEDAGADQQRDQGRPLPAGPPSVGGRRLRVPARARVGSRSGGSCPHDSAACLRPRCGRSVSYL